MNATLCAEDGRARSPPAPAGAALATRLQGLHLTLDVDPRWQAGVDQLFATFAPGPSTGTPLAVAHAVLGRTTLPRPADAHERPIFRATAGDPVLRDRTHAWDAELRFGPRRLDASFALRDDPLLRDHPHELAFIRELVSSALRVTLGSAAPLADALLVHGAALVEPTSGVAVLFLGPSGAGKTTMARRLPDWQVLADDTAWLARGDQGWVVSGTPLRGKEGNPRSGTPVALGALATLVPAARELSVTRLSEADAMRELLARIFWCVGVPSHEAQLVEVAHAVVATLPSYRLMSSLAHDVAWVARDLACTPRPAVAP